MSYIGIKGVERLDPTGKLNLQQAENMLKALSSNVSPRIRRSFINSFLMSTGLTYPEADMAKIKAKTGWEKGVDGKWRYEIPDLFRLSDNRKLCKTSFR